MLKEKKGPIIETVRFIFRTYEVFHGKPESPPTDIIKAMIKVLISILPQSVRLSLRYPKFHDQVLSRVVEKIYRLAEKELREREEIKYIS